MTDQDARREPSRGELIREFDEVLDRVSRMMRQMTTRELSETYGLSILQLSVLASLWQTGPELEMSSLAGACGLPASSVTSIVDRLVKLGLVERRHSEVDRRRVLAKITPAGDDVMTRFDVWSRQMLEQMLSRSDTEDIAACLRVFNDAERQSRETFSFRWPVDRE